VTSPKAARRGGSKKVVLALDVGTSSGRSSLYDARGARLRDAGCQLAYTIRTTADGGAELDPAELFDRLVEAIDGAHAAAVAGRHRVVAVATSTFWHSLLGLDADGRPLTPVYLWMDARSRADAVGLQRELDQAAVHARTGCRLHWSYWPAKLRWLRRTRPDLFPGVARWVSFAEYAEQQLTGRTGVSVSMASGTGLLDQHRCQWDAELLRAVGLGPERLGPLVPLTAEPGGLRPRFARRWPELERAPWLPAVGDGAASNLGAGCATRDRFAVMIGTSCAERVVWRPGRDFTIPAQTWCYRVDEARVVMGGAMNDGGSLVDWLHDSLQLGSLKAAERAAARLEPDAHGLTVLPLWGGERSPGWAPDARGAIVGLRFHHRPADIFRAALEAVALRFGEVDRALREAVPESREVVATGGALLHAPVWLQIMADVLGRPVTASAEPQASSRGVALLAFESLGLLPRPIEAVVPAARAVYQPVPAHTERYRAAAARQRALYAQLIQPAP
jgi:gluconokinase